MGDPLPVNPEGTDAEGHDVPRPRLRRLVAPVLAALAVVQPTATLAARLDWRADLLSHPLEPALVLTGLAAAVALVGRRWRISLVMVLLAAWQAAPLFRNSGPNPVPPDPTSAARMRVLVANVHEGNVEPERMIALIRRERPDVVGLIEVSEDWLFAMRPLRREYPYRAEFPAGSAGMVLWLRERPITLSREPEKLLPWSWPSLIATVPFDGRPLTIRLVHQSDPLWRRGERPGHPEFVALAEEARRIGPRCLIVGDMNSTDRSPYFRDFLRDSGLRDSRLGFGNQASWPVVSPFRIAIDHAFLSPDLAVVDRRLGGDVGSDHLPVLLDLAPAAPESGGRVKSMTQAPHESR